MTLLQSLKELYVHFSTRRRWQLLGLLTLMLVGALAEMATLGAVVPFLAMIADPNIVHKYPAIQPIYSYLGGTQQNMLLYSAIFFALIAVGAGFIRMLLMWASLRISYGLGADIGLKVFENTLYRPYAWHVRHNSSEVLSSIDKVNSVIWGVLVQIIQALVALVLSVGVLGMLLMIDFQSALIAAIGFTAIYGLTSLLLKQKLKESGDVVSRSMKSRVRVVQEGLGGIRDVILDHLQPIYARQFAQNDYAMRKGQAEISLMGASPRYIIEALGMILIVAMAVWLSSHRDGLAGAIPVLGALAVGAQKLLPQMQLVYSGWSGANGNHQQLLDVLKMLEAQGNAPEVCTEKSKFFDNGERSSAPALKPFKGLSKPLIKVEGLSFEYGTDLPCVLRKINLEIQQGSRVGFIGKTGSGKSTLIDIIMGLLKPTVGRVCVDGVVLNEQNLQSWQKRIAHVPQSIYLSDASIAENIAFGIDLSLIDLAKVKAAAEQAQLVEFIESLPQNYATHVGERGVRLSGGQRQRIGIARALYKEADLLILDEATSALDSHTEQAVMNAIRSNGKQMTIIMIAHRISTLQECNLIVELGSGSIVQTGTAEILDLPKQIIQIKNNGGNYKHA